MCSRLVLKTSMGQLILVTDDWDFFAQEHGLEYLSWQLKDAATFGR